jgi:hypothetical protein
MTNAETQLLLAVAESLASMQDAPMQNQIRHCLVALLTERASLPLVTYSTPLVKGNGA